MKFVWEAAPGVVIGEIIARVAVALVPLSVLLVTRSIVDSIEAYKAHQTALPHYFWWLVALEFALAGFAAVLIRLIDFCDVTLAERFMRHISITLMKHAANLDLLAYEDPVFYDKLERARVQSTDRVQTIKIAGRLIQEVITTVSLAAGILFFSPLLLLALIVCVVPAFLGETHFAFLGYSMSFQQTPARRELDYLRTVSGTKEGAKEVKLFGLAPFLVGRYSDVADKLCNQTVGVARRKLTVGALLGLLGVTGYYGTYAFVIYQTLFGSLSIGQMIMLTGAIGGASTNIQAVFTTFSEIANQALFMTDLLEFFAVKPKIQSRPNAIPAPKRIQQGFEFKNVSFSYPGSSRLVLKNVIVKLLTRLYDPTDGQILLDGRDLREYDLDSLWQQIGVIFQDFMRYEMTASANIAVGRIEERHNPFQIRAAANKSLAEQAIRKLPKGFDQVLGSRFEGAVDLSGGEWQKIAIARAYLRDAQLLVLDEPTAALDARSEHEVFQRFAELTQGKMSVLISHRFSTVKMSNRILVLKGGEIAEQGPHDQLLKEGGHYAELFELQAANYR
jgi:ATP-binding cassette subfamily B protein